MWRSLILIFLAVYSLQACKPAGPPPLETGSAIRETQSSQVETFLAPTPVLLEATPTKEATPNPLSGTATFTDCLKAGGHVVIEEYTTELLADPLVYRIYLPPCYNEEPDRHYPVLYLIHGKYASDVQWNYLGAATTLDQLVASGEVAPFIMVMPRDRVWSEPPANKFGEAVVQSLVPWVDEHYRTLPEREYRAIGGLSRGGAWAIHIGFPHPEMFGSVGLHSSVVFNTDVAKVVQWLDNFPEGMTPRVYVDIGDNDRPDITRLTTWVESMLTKYEIPHEWHMDEGGHDDAYWMTHVEEYLRWYGQGWGRDPGTNDL